MKKSNLIQLTSLLLTLALLLPILGTTALAVGDGTKTAEHTPKTDASIAIREALDENHKIFESTYRDPQTKTEKRHTAIVDSRSRLRLM